MIENARPVRSPTSGANVFAVLRVMTLSFRSWGSEKPGSGQSAGFKLRPNLSRLHCKKAGWVTAVFEQGGKTQALEQLRALIEAVVLTPEEGDLAIDLRGELASMLSLYAGAETQKASAGEPLEVL